MKQFFSIVFVLLLSTVVHAQSGRRAKQIVVPVSPPPEANEATLTKPPDSAPQVTAEPNHFYSCSDDGTLTRIVETSEAEPKIFSSKEVDARAIIISKPPPTYTKEARRNGVQGFVVLKVLLTAEARVDRIRVTKRLPAGLTENAIRAACKLKFKPAMKNGQSVAQLVTLEYVFRLAHSSIFGP